MANLKQALTELREEQTSEYEELMKKQARHKFSRIYLKRRKAVIDMTSQAAKAMHDDYKYRAVKRFSLRTALVAAIVMILATVSVIAIAKPEIIFNIKGVSSWEKEVIVNNLTVISLTDCTVEIFINCCWENLTAVVVDMFTNNINAGRGCKHANLAAVSVHFNKIFF